jgi:mannose-6-phosphate isomerase-like protein (cupin superfamily)
MAHTGEEFENPVSGERSVVRQGSDDTDGELVVADLYLRPGAGGPREHAHSYLHETFEILDGRVGFRLNGHQEVTGPGRKLVVEPGMVHDFWNAGEQEAHVLVEVRPGAGSSRSSRPSGGWPRRGRPMRGGASAAVAAGGGGQGVRAGASVRLAPALAAEGVVLGAGADRPGAGLQGDRSSIPGAGPTPTRKLTVT